jgi:polar amino acid transport system substrate-binding protein
MDQSRMKDVTLGSRSSKPHTRTIATLMVAASSLTLAACGASTSAASATPSVKIDGATITAVASLASHVPAAIKSSGLVDITYNDAPPDELVTNGNLVGWEVDLGKAVAATLGVAWHATASSAFDSFIPGLQNGRYNSSFTSFITTPDRLKQIDIVTYDNIGTGFAVLKSSSLSITKSTSLCGKSVAVITGSAFIAQIKGVDPTCTKANLPSVNVVSFPTDSAAELAVSSGRDQVYSSSADQLAWLIKKTEHQFRLQSLNYQPTAQGAGVAKKAGITNLIGEAMDHLIKTGAYKKIMNHWGQTFGLVTKATVYK